jgi:hypothetical protein
MYRSGSIDAIHKKLSVSSPILEKMPPLDEVVRKQNDYLHPKYSLPSVKVDVVNELVCFLMVYYNGFNQEQWWADVI